MRFLAGVLAVLLAAVLASAALAAPSEIESLLDEMGGGDTAKWYPAYRTLSERRDPAVVAPLLDRIGKWQTTPQSYGVSLLQSLPADRTEGAWKKLLAADSAYLRACAAAQIRTTDPARASKVAAEAVAASQRDGTVTMVLGRLHFWKDAAVQAAVRDLVRPDAESVVIGMALDVLRSDDDASAAPQARRVVAEGKGAARALAAAWLVRFGDRSQAQAIADALAAGELTYGDFNRIRPWLEDAGGAPDAVLEAAITRVEIETNEAYAAALATFLGNARHAPALPALRRLADCDRPTVAKAAYDALASVPGGLDADALRKQLASPEPSRRLAAAKALRRSDDFSGFDAVLELAKPGSAVRQDAVEALGDFRNAASMDVLIDALDDANVSVRIAAQSSLQEVFRGAFPYRRLNLSTTGYSTNADAAARAQSVAAIRAWWASVRDKTW